MEETISAVINSFETFFELWGQGPGSIEKVAPLAYVWHPPKALENSSQKPVHLTLQAITHGNEVGGMDVLLSTAQLLRSGILTPSISIGFALGNPFAAKANRRFLLRDLNRSFGRKTAEDDEDKRARELEPLLAKTAFFLDIHQTIEPTLKPFFIFPYTEACFDFAQALHSKIPVVTHWGSSFSKDGMCTDEYVNYKGGVGITLELGQKGFDTYQSGVGLQVALEALSFVQAKFLDGARFQQKNNSSEIYTWKEVVAFTEGMLLDEGLVNFQELKQGQAIGRTRSGALAVPKEGWLLFPKYIRDPLASPPKEIFRIMKRVKREELGKEGVMGI